MENDTELISLETNDIKRRIFTVRGRQVMLDKDLAELYGYEVKKLNQQVKRNLERFPEDFMFQLRMEEIPDSSKSQIVTLNERGNKRGSNIKKLPYAFTEQGIYMLSTVLRGDLAIKQSIFIMRAFREMRHFIANNAALFERISKVESYPESPFIKGEIERLKEKLVKNTEKNDCAQNQEEENSSPDPLFRRMSRGLFAILFIALWILSIMIFGIISDNYGTDSAGTNVVVALILLTSLYLIIRRLHDLNRPAWLSVLAIVPYINLAMLVYLLFFKGTSGPNRFGADPLEQ